MLSADSRFGRGFDSRRLHHFSFALRVFMGSDLICDT